MTRKQAAASLAEQKFNELDNWLGIMDLDPPHSSEEKRLMYKRLMEILEVMFDAEDPHSATLAQSSLDSLDKKSYYRDLRKLIPR
jgi:hypothetical protein